MGTRSVRALVLALPLAAAGCPRPTPVDVSPPAAACTPDQIDDMFAAATPEDDTYTVTCSVTVDQERANERITKMLRFTDRSSGVTLDCNGATLAFERERRSESNQGHEIMILVASVLRDGEWKRPQDITIRRCSIKGAIRIRGIGADLLPEESVREGYVRKLRADAPTRIVLDRLAVELCGESGCDRGEPQRENAVYLTHGVNHVTLQRSSVTGRMRGPGVYLAPESFANVFRDNVFSATSTNNREELAIDGSAHNSFFNNRFSSLETGGIFIYRNCGENGFVRFTEPSHNQIINNVFYYNRYTGSNPSIWFGKRFGWDNCRHDDNLLGDRYLNGVRNDSSHDNGSYARDNVVMQNQIFRRSVSEMILTTDDRTSAPNHVAFNTTVTPDDVLAVGAGWPTGWSDGRVPPYRRAGCYAAAGYKPLVLDGETIDVIQVNGRPLCSPKRMACADGVISLSNQTGCTIHERPFECHGEGDDAGCASTVTCPAGTRAVGAAALCHLELGAENTIAEDAPSRPPWQGAITVTRASDDVDDGTCFAGGTRLSTGSAKLAGVFDQTSIAYGCSEHDDNGGDCQIRGLLYCR